MTTELVKQHIFGMVRAGMAESSGFEEEADRLRSQGYLRLMVMSDEELRELSQMLMCVPVRPPDVIYQELKQVIEDQKAACNEWLAGLGV